MEKVEPVFSSRCGAQDSLNTMKWKVLPKAGRVDGVLIKAPSALLAVSRNLLTDGRGVPLSFVVTGANRHDVRQRGEETREKKAAADTDNRIPLLHIPRNGFLIHQRPWLYNYRAGSQ